MREAPKWIEHDPRKIDLDRASQVAHIRETMRDQSPAIITIREASGRVIRANVHGSGGPIPFSSGPERVRNLIRLATEGRPLRDAYEPATGYVRAYIVKAEGNGSEGVIDLRGATFISFE